MTLSGPMRKVPTTAPLFQFSYTYCSGSHRRGKSQRVMAVRWLRKTPESAKARIKKVRTSPTHLWRRRQVRAFSLRRGGVLLFGKDIDSIQGGYFDSDFDIDFDFRLRLPSG